MVILVHVLLAHNMVGLVAFMQFPVPVVSLHSYAFHNFQISVALAAGIDKRTSGAVVRNCAVGMVVRPHTCNTKDKQIK